MSFKKFQFRKGHPLSPICLLTLFLVFNSCTKEKLSINNVQEIKTDSSILAYIKELGYNDSDIKDLGEEYLVDGDIVFSKNTIIKNTTKAKGLKVSQYGTGSHTNENVVIQIDPSMNNYINEIYSAVTHWNNVLDCSLDFSVYSPGQTTPPNIIITNANLGSGVCGQSYFPVNNKPGSLIRININEISGLPFEQRQRTITHELGHAIGLRHTNWQGHEATTGNDPSNGAYYDAIHIPGTPTGIDASSLMNSGECGTGATYLSDYDKIAIRSLYFQPTPNWQQLSGGARDISIGADGSVFIIGTDYNYNNGGARIFKWANNDWTPIGGYAIAIAVAPNGVPWVVNSFGSIFRRDGNVWTQVPGGAKDIGIGADGSIFIIGTDYNYNNGGARIFKWANNDWTPIGGYAIAIAVAPNGVPWMVNSFGSICRRDGNVWTQLFGGAKDIGIGADGKVYIIGTDTLNGGYGTFTWTGNSWNKFSGAGIKIAGDLNGKPWLINSYNVIFKYF